MSSQKGPKYIYAQEHNGVTFTIINALEGIEKTKTEKKKKKTTKQPEEYFFHNAVTHYQHQSRVQNAIGVDFAFHWLKNCRQTFQPITERSKRNRIITFDSHLRTAVTSKVKP